MASMSQRRNMTHSQQQRMILEHRRQEDRRLDQSKRIAQDRQMQASLVNEQRMEEKRRMRTLQDEQHERQLEEALLRAEEERLMRDKQLEQEERMAKELARINHEKLRHQKIRQYVKENSIELRELESKLKSAYLNRERSAQIAEKEAMKYETMRQDAEAARLMKSEHEAQGRVEEEKGDAGPRAREVQRH
ncbi:hypothetical protein AALO_G00272790 [Alosa alosa]|uniref:Meiosis-specific nuclear structural protein 1 n=1 Tax=Alosa alosa TaxID=278164 RepID=A0AAV6FNU6_9TELE|nr:hypothetical protein AALO_G00272790 [Alosa alosa]